MANVFATASTSQCPKWLGDSELCTMDELQRAQGRGFERKKNDANAEMFHLRESP